MNSVLWVNCKVTLPHSELSYYNCFRNNSDIVVKFFISQTSIVQYIIE